LVFFLFLIKLKNNLKYLKSVLTYIPRFARIKATEIQIQHFD